MNFQVTLEESPSETYTNVSAELCWEMVLQRLNQEIISRRSLGEQGLPPLQSVNGLDMFGFHSQSIIEVCYLHASLTSLIFAFIKGQNLIPDTWWTMGLYFNILQYPYLFNFLIFKIC